MEADAAPERCRRRDEEGLELRPDDAQCAVVLEERLIDVGEALEDFGAARELLAHFDEGADNKEVHLDGTRAVQDIGRLQGAVLGERVRRVRRPPRRRFDIALCDIRAACSSAVS